MVNGLNGSEQIFLRRFGKKFYKGITTTIALQKPNSKSSKSQLADILKSVLTSSIRLNPFPILLARLKTKKCRRN